MELTYMVIVAGVVFLVGEFLKVCNLDSKWLPFINILAGAIAAGVSFWAQLLPCETPYQILSGIGACVVAALGAGGAADAVKTKIKESGVLVDAESKNEAYDGNDEARGEQE